MIIIPLWLICIALAAFIGSTKSRTGAGLALGIFLGPIGILMAFTLDDSRWKCPQCAERIMVGAKLCPHCRTSFTLPAVPAVNPGSSDDA